MDATRARFSFVTDYIWERLHRAVVAATIVLLVTTAALFVRELRVARTFVAAGEPAVNAAQEVMSVPALVLSGGREIRVGDAKPDTLANLQPQALMKRTEERGPFGAREVWSYAGFSLVFEPFERAGEPRVAAIYVQ